MIITIKKNSLNTRFWTRTAILLALALVFQMGGFPQPITGPVVNAILFLSVLTVTPLSGAVIGILTPVIAFIRGILPPPLAPMIPFIAVGNALLVFAFSLIGKLMKLDFKKPLNFTGGFAVVVASFLKFSLLAAAVRFLVEIPPPVAQMMTFPQLYTAIAGGVLALLIYKILPLD